MGIECEKYSVHAYSVTITTVFPVMGLSQGIPKAARIKVKFPGIGMLKFRMDQRRQIWSEPECSVVECDV